MQSGVDELLKAKQTEYSDAWKLSGLVFSIDPIKVSFTTMITKCPEYVYAWIIIMNKLFRVLASPYHLDSWKDIAGYATLVVRDLEGKWR